MFDDVWGMIISKGVQSLVFEILECYLPFSSPKSNWKALKLHPPIKLQEEAAS